MKRKQLIAVGILGICLLASGCGSNTTSTEQGTEDTLIVQETETQETETEEVETQEVETETQEEETKTQEVATETQEVATETQEVETQETEEQETADNVEETTMDSERLSLPCDGRDGTAEAPYKIGDEIVFPNYRVGVSDEGKDVYSDITIVVQEATSDYIKVSVDYGMDSWAGIRTFDRTFNTYFFLRGYSEIGESLAHYTEVVYKDEAGNKIEEFDEDETFVEAYISYENTRTEADVNIGDAKYLVFVKMGTVQGEDPYTYIILE